MKTINFNEPAFTYRYKKKEFLPLISEDFMNKEDLANLLRGKIEKENYDEIEGLWGTLGFQDGRRLNWTGKIEHSNYGAYGNELAQSKLITTEVDLVKEAIPELKSSNKITQRFINLSELNIDFPAIINEGTIPKLRLELFLKEDEGAIVFYQYEREGEDEEAMDYILPEATDHDHSFKRDRLTYIFNAIPKYALKDIAEFPGQKSLSDKKLDVEFIIKILVFKRTFTDRKNKAFVPANSKDLIKLIHDDISTKNGLFVKDYKLQVYDRESRSFKTAVKNTSRVKHSIAKRIDTTKKTLVLFHGTFSSTRGSFGKVYESENSWLNQLYDSGIYEQVLAFDHPTVLKDAKTNVSNFVQSLMNCDKANFEQEVDIIGTSQGGLLAKTIAILTPNEQYNIEVGKVALVACANGVGYLDFLSKSTTGLKLVKRMLRAFGLAPASFIVGLVQNSVKAILKLDGFEIMLSGSEKLNKILYSLPSNKKTRYLPVVSTMDYKEGDGNYNFGEGFDAFVDLFLGKDNDWVVSTKNQFKVPSFFAAIKGYNPMKYKNEMFIARHGELIENKDAQSVITNFFQKTGIPFNAKGASEDYFDAHCHLFGKNVISARILMMILGDLIDYLKDNRNATKNQKIKSKEKCRISILLKNLFKYIVFNQGGQDMLDDLEKEYNKFRKSGTNIKVGDEEVVYRYIPLMFDLEMTFKNNYHESSCFNSNLQELNDKFKQAFGDFSKEMKRLSSNIDESNLDLVVGSLKDKADFSRLLKRGVQIISTFTNFNGEVKDSFEKQLNEMKQLKHLYGKDLFPFIATDPRRPGMGKIIEEHLGQDEIFQGIKIYAPNGYSPADKHFYDGNFPFVFGKPLYQWCVENNIPILAHNSNAGFATFADTIEYTGIIMDPITMQLSEYSPKIQTKNFETNLFNGGFKEGVKERALVLNHPKIWRKVLEKYPELKVCFAHFGGEIENSMHWRNEIAQLIRDFDNTYTDLSCLTNREVLAEIRDGLLIGEKIKNRIMYGSDYFLNMFDDITFHEYYKNFKTVFSDEELEHMSVDVPKYFLGIT